MEGELLFLKKEPQKSILRDVTVYDKFGKKLQPCTEIVASVLITRKRAIRTGDKTITLILDKKDIKDIRKKVIARDKNICFFCGEKIPEGEIITVDHLVARHITREGKCGYDSEENLVCACLECNQDKGTMSADEYITKRFMYTLGYICIKNNLDIEEVLYGEYIYASTPA